MVDILSSTGADPLRGTKLKQEEDKKLGIQPAPLSPLPDLDKPINITEDINFAESEENELGFINEFDQDPANLEFNDNNAEDFKFLQSPDTDDLDFEEEVEAVFSREVDEDLETEDYLVEQAALENDDDYTPRSYEEYLKDEDRINAGIQIGRTSLIKHAWEWMRQAVDKDYIPEDSIKGREASIQILQGQLKDLGDIELDGTKLSERKVRQADFIWDNIYRLTELNALDKANAESEMPSVSEFVELVAEHPSLIANEMVKEIANKPELFFIAPFAAYRTALAATSVASRLNAGVTTVRVAKHLGGATGAAGGAFTLGTLDRALEQSTSHQEIDLARAAKQSIIDAQLGLVLYGSGKVLSKSMASAKKVRAQRKVARKKANDLAGTTEANLNSKLEAQDIELAIQDKATETYVDASGSVYTFEVRDISTYENRAARIKELKETKANLTNPAAKKVVQKQINAEEELLQADKLEGQKPTRLTGPRKSLEADEPKVSGDAAEKWLNMKEPKPVITKNYIKYTDEAGNEVVLRRLTPKLLKSKGVMVQGINSLDLVQPKNVEQATNSFMHVFKDFAISATSALEPLANSSAAARLLLDTVNPHAGTRGRAPIETIQEATHMKQAMYANEIARLTEGMTPAQSVALTKHMRQVEESTDPRVVEAATGLRTLIQGAVKYARTGGMKVDYDDSWLPRYYDQKSLKDLSAQERLADAVSGIKDDTDITLYSREDALKSANKIAHNIRESSDEGVHIEIGGTINPIGHRSWKDVPDSQLHEWLGDDVAGDINKYLTNLVKRTEHDKVFGYNGSNINKWIKQIDEDLKGERILTEAEVDGIKDLYDLVSGRYGGKPVGKGATDAALAATNFLKLPFVTLTSALEPTSLLFKVGPTPAIKGILDAYGLKFGRQALGTKKMERMIEESKAVGLTHSAAVKERLDAMVGDGLEGLPATINNKVMKGFLLHQWTEHTRVVAYEAAHSEIMHTIRRIAKDPDAISDRRWLAEQGIHPEKALEWLDKGANAEDAFYSTIHKGGGRLANTMIANPNKLNKPKWLSSRASIPRLAGAFKSFGAVFNNDVAKSTLDEITKLWNEGSKVKALNKSGLLLSTISAMSFWTAYKFNVVGTAVAGGSPVGDDEETDVAMKMMQGIVGLMVPGGSLIAPMVGTRNITSQMAGPTIGLAETVARGDFDKISPIPNAVEKMSGGSKSNRKY